MTCGVEIGDGRYKTTRSWFIVYETIYVGRCGLLFRGNKPLNFKAQNKYLAAFHGR